MSQLIIFDFREGDFEQGFSVKFTLKKQGQEVMEISGSLPAASALPRLYTAWKVAYQKLGGLDNRLSLPEAQVTHISINEGREVCQQAAQDLQNHFNHWLSQLYPTRIRDVILRQVGESDPVRVIIQSQHPLLRRLPWHSWDLFEHNYQAAEIAVSTDDFLPPPLTPPMTGKIKILAVLGDSQGIDVQTDRQLLEQLSNAAVNFLVEPTRQQFNDALWNQQGWHLLFFAGHSATSVSGEAGYLQLNPTERVTVADLRNALKTAIDRGLRLAIFNSCDGLGLAWALADLQIPQMIVMREPVADHVAQEFLKYFLNALSSGTPLFPSVRQAREQLQGLEGHFPCASWLPVICQNPIAEPLMWPKQPAQLPWKLIGSGLGAMAIVLIPLLLWLSKHSPLAQVGPTSMTSSAVETARLGQRFSLGERVLITGEETPQKLKGAHAFAQKDYDTAIKQWEISLQVKPNDPETRIYLNNARAAQQGLVRRIAIVVPIGSNLDSAEEMLRGLAQAQEAANATPAQFQGAMLQVQIANDDNKAILAEQIAKALVQDQSILAVVGHNSTTASKAAAPIYQAGGLVMMNPTASGTGILAGSYIFRITTTSREHAILISDYATKVARIGKFAICSDATSPSSQEWKGEFVEILLSRGSLISAVPCDFADASFRPNEFVSQVKADRVQGLMLLPSAERVNEALQIAKAAHGLALFGNTILYTPETLKQGRNDVNGMVLAVAWHPQSNSNQLFLQTANKLWQGTINWRTAMTYDAALTVITALHTTNTRYDLQKVLATPGLKAIGATGTIELLPSGERKRTSESGLGTLIMIRPDRKSPIGYSFFPLPQSPKP